MTSCVVDASVGVKWYVPETLSDQAHVLIKAAALGELTIHVPDLFLQETANTLWKKFRREELGRRDVRAIHEALSAVPKQVHGSSGIVEAVLELACDLDRTVYDATYLALAIQLDCELVTADKRLCHSLVRTPWQENVCWVGNLSNGERE